MGGLTPNLNDSRAPVPANSLMLNTMTSIPKIPNDQKFIAHKIILPT